MASKNIKNDVNSDVWEMEVIFNDTLSSPESAYESAYNFRTFLKKSDGGQSSIIFHKFAVFYSGIKNIQANLLNSIGYLPLHH